MEGAPSAPSAPSGARAAAAAVARPSCGARGPDRELPDVSGVNFIQKLLQPHSPFVVLQRPAFVVHELRVRDRAPPEREGRECSASTTGDRPQSSQRFPGSPAGGGRRTGATWSSRKCCSSRTRARALPLYLRLKQKHQDAPRASSKANSVKKMLHSEKQLRPQRDLNSRPLVYKTSALTPELWSRCCRLRRARLLAAPGTGRRDVWAAFWVWGLGAGGGGGGPPLRRPSQDGSVRTGPGSKSEPPPGALAPLI